MPQGRDIGGFGDPVDLITLDITDGDVTLTGEYLVDQNYEFPTQRLGVASKGYVDSIASGLSVKPPAKSATIQTLESEPYSTSGVTYTSGVFTQTNPTDGTFTGVDGDTSQVNDRILIKDQVDQKQNGIYILTTVGDGISNPWVLTRAEDFNESSEVGGGSACFVQSGTVNINSTWVTQGGAVLILDTDDINWIKFSGLGQVTTESGIYKIGDTIGVSNYSNINTHISRVDNPHSVSYSQLGNSDNITQGITNLLMTTSERSKLSGIEASANNYQTFDTDFDTRLGTKTTDNLSEGVTNKYISQAELDKLGAIEVSANNYQTFDIDFDTRLGIKTTDNLTEGVTNKYISQAELDKLGAIEASANNYQTFDTDFDTRLGTKTTDNLSEGVTNKYLGTTATDLNNHVITSVNPHGSILKQSTIETNLIDGGSIATLNIEGGDAGISFQTAQITMSQTGGITCNSLSTNTITGDSITPMTIENLGQNINIGIVVFDSLGNITAPNNSTNSLGNITCNSLVVDGNNLTIDTVSGSITQTSDANMYFNVTGNATRKICLQKDGLDVLCANAEGVQMVGSLTAVTPSLATIPQGTNPVHLNLKTNVNTGPASNISGDIRMIAGNYEELCIQANQTSKNDAGKVIILNELDVTGATLTGFPPQIAPVQSVNTKTGVVVLTAADVGAATSTALTTHEGLNTQTADPHGLATQINTNLLSATNIITGEGVGTIFNGDIPVSLPLSTEIPSNGNIPGSVSLNPGGSIELDCKAPLVPGGKGKVLIVNELDVTGATLTGFPQPPTAPVQSVNTKTGIVVLTAADVGAATSTALTTHEGLNTQTSNPHGLATQINTNLLSATNIITGEGVGTIFNGDIPVSLPLSTEIPSNGNIPGSVSLNPGGSIELDCKAPLVPGGKGKVLIVNELDVTGATLTGVINDVGTGLNDILSASEIVSRIEGAVSTTIGGLLKHRLNTSNTYSALTPHVIPFPLFLFGVNQQMTYSNGYFTTQVEGYFHITYEIICDDLEGGYRVTYIDTSYDTPQRHGYIVQKGVDMASGTGQAFNSSCLIFLPAGASFSVRFEHSFNNVVSVGSTDVIKFCDISIHRLRL